MKITLINNPFNIGVLKGFDLQETIMNMKNDSEDELIKNIRYLLQFVTGDSRVNEVQKVPKILFSSTFKKRDGELIMEKYNGVVLVEINRLAGMDIARSVRDDVAKYPQTMAAFIGLSGKSVKILVRFTRTDGSLPQTEQEAEPFHAQAYAWAVKFYRSLIPYSVKVRPSSLKIGCRLSYDPDLYFDPDVVPIQLEQSVVEMNSCKECAVPNEENRERLSILFESALTSTVKEVGSEMSGDNLKNVLVTLAQKCSKSGIEEEDVVRWSILHFALREREMEVRTIIRSVYLVSTCSGASPCIPKEKLLAMEMHEFMSRRYQFRYNVQTTEVEYRERNSFCFDFVPISERVLNSIVLNAMEEGLQLWDRDVKRYVNSDRVPQYSPIEEYLCGLPQWDGKDRIRQLANAAPCKNSHWNDLFHRWFLCMVAHWRGMDKTHANSTAPLLIGPQGYNKSTFCLSILPPQLRTYYTDSIDFGNKRDSELNLNRFALINMDEFDQISTNQQAFLKHILQKPVVNTRKPHQTAVKELRRYASFIATSNHADLLTDTSGSRRFICVQMTAPVRLDTPINYPQLYAQALQEIRQGVRYWFDAEEEIMLNKNNEDFQQTPPAEQLLQQYFRPAEENEPCEKLLAVEILGRLQKRSGFKLSTTKITHFGRILHKTNIPIKKTMKGVFYCVVERME